MYYLVFDGRVCFPLEEGLCHLGVPVLARKMEWSETGSIDTVHKTGGFKQDLDNVIVPRPASFVEGSVAKLKRRGKERE